MWVCVCVFRHIVTLSQHLHIHHIVTLSQQLRIHHSVEISQHLHSHIILSHFHSIYTLHIVTLLQHLHTSYCHTFTASTHFILSHFCSILLATLLDLLGVGGGRGGSRVLVDDIDGGGGGDRREEQPSAADDREFALLMMQSVAGHVTSLNDAFVYKRLVHMMRTPPPCSVHSFTGHVSECQCVAPPRASRVFAFIFFIYVYTCLLLFIQPFSAVCISNIFHVFVYAYVYIHVCTSHTLFMWLLRWE